MDRLRQQHPFSESVPRQGGLEISAQERKPGLHIPDLGTVQQTKYLLLNKDRIFFFAGFKVSSYPTTDSCTVRPKFVTG